MSTAHHLTEAPPLDAINLLIHLGNLDVPVWTATTGTNGREVNRPHGWQAMTADGNRDRMSGWRPGMAFSGNMGGRVVVLDGDTRNGCNIDQVEAMLNGIAVTVYAAVDTPSGGRHWYVPGHPDIPTIHATTDRDGLTGYPGLEVISYGANVFLPGTQRPKYGGRGYTILFDRLPELAETPDPESAENLAAWVAAHRRATPEPFTPTRPWDGQPPDTRQQRYLDATLSNTARRAADAPQGERNTRLFHAAMCLGNYITGAGLDETAAVTALQAAAATSGLTRDDGPGSVNATIQSGLRVGKSLPRAVPDPTHQPATELTIERTPQPWDTTTNTRAAPASEEDTKHTSPPTHESSNSKTADTATAAKNATPPDAASTTTDDDPAGRARKLWPRIDWHKLWADETDIEWILEPILPAGRLVALYSPPKTGKSLLMLEMAVHVSKGTPFLTGHPEKRHRVLYVDFENDPRGDIRTRLENMRYTPDDLDYLDYLSYPTIGAFDTERGGLELIEAVKAYESEVVIVDTISRAVSGEENSNDTWLAFYRNTGFLLKQAGVSLIRLDHTGKDVERGQRGGSAKSGDVDAIWRLTTIKRDELYRLECTDARMQIETKEMTLRRHDCPLRHTIEKMPAITAGEEKVRAAVDALRAAGVPAGAGRPTIAPILREHGIRLGSRGMAEVVKQWRTTPTTAVDNPSEPVDKTVPGAPLEQTPRGQVQTVPGTAGTVGDSWSAGSKTRRSDRLSAVPDSRGQSGTAHHRTPLSPLSPPHRGDRGQVPENSTKNGPPQQGRVVIADTPHGPRPVNLDTGDVLN